MDKVLQHYKLWVGIACKGIQFKTEMEMLDIVLDLTNGSVHQRDILSIQRVVTKEPLYIIYCANTDVKSKIISCVVLEVDGREYELVDFESPHVKSFGTTCNSVRVSIHGIPLSDILSIQRVVTKEPLYIIYCANTDVKSKIISCVVLEVDGRI